MGKYILALDEGTTSARAILFDAEAHIVDMVQKEFTQFYPHPGWVEQDPMEIYAAQYGVMMELIAKNGLSAEDIHAIGIANQRETVIVWDRETGRPIAPAIVWQCRRTAEMCELLKQNGKADLIYQKTGLLVDAYFSATKLAWILDHVEGAREAARAGKLCFGTVDTWLLYRLTGSRVHATDVTNASRTMLFNIHTTAWDEELLSLFNIPASVLPQVYPSGHIFGHLNMGCVQIPIAGIAGDQQAALFGQLCTKAGECKNTYGTGCFLLMHTGDTPKSSQGGLLTTVAATMDGQKTQYALEGSVFVGGAVIQWLRDSLGLIRDAEDSAYFAAKAQDNDGVYVVPAFTGLGAPHWDMYARGTIVGLSRASGRNVIVRAALESIAYQTNDILSLMAKDSGISIPTLKVDGGASANPVLMQFQADISGVEVKRPAMLESTALGAAFLAGLSTGFWKDEAALRAYKQSNEGEFTFLPAMDEEKRTSLCYGWKRALRAVRAWSELEDDTLDI